MSAKHNAKTIMIMAGGTGGHVFPGLAVAQQLQQLGYRVLWLGSQGGMEERLVPQHNISMCTVSLRGLRGGSLGRWLKAPWVLMRALWQTLGLIKRERPLVVLGMGGFVSGPGGVAARLLRIPLIIHEQNAVAGFTNRTLARYCASRVLAAFPHSFKQSKLRHRAQEFIVGNPLRATITNKSSSTALRPLRVLVLGGSLGARTLNQAVPAAVASLSQDIELWHQTGKSLYDETQAVYQHLHLKARIDAFIDDMNEAYHWADLVIARAGALTVTEICAVGIASILIPYPHAVDNHQVHNARTLVDDNAALMLANEQCTPEILSTFLKTLIENPTRLTEMAQACEPLRTLDATAKVVQHCIELSETNTHPAVQPSSSPHLAKAESPCDSVDPPVESEGENKKLSERSVK